MEDEGGLLASLHADRYSDYTVMGVIRLLKEHGWRIVKLEVAQSDPFIEATSFYVEAEL